LNADSYNLAYGHPSDYTSRDPEPGADTALQATGTPLSDAVPSRNARWARRFWSWRFCIICQLICLQSPILEMLGLGLRLERQGQREGELTTLEEGFEEDFLRDESGDCGSCSS
jgi:hypothetical protein